MLVTEAPQFPLIAEPSIESNLSTEELFATNIWGLSDNDHVHAAIEPEILETFALIQTFFARKQLKPQRSVALHDVTGFIVQKLLLCTPLTNLGKDMDVALSKSPSPLSKCFSFSLALYMLFVHGRTYYSHADLAQRLAAEVREHWALTLQQSWCYTTFNILRPWILSVSLVAVEKPSNYEWFQEEARNAADALGLSTWEDVLLHLERVLWWSSLECSEFVRQSWLDILQPTA